MALAIQQGIIMVCTPDLYLQEFRFEGPELRQWKHKFLKRLDEYYKTSNNLHRRAAEFYHNVLLKKQNYWEILKKIKLKNRARTSSGFMGSCNKLAQFAVALKILG